MKPKERPEWRLKEDQPLNEVHQKQLEIIEKSKRPDYRGVYRR